MRTIEWVHESNRVRMIDQRKLPGSFEYLYADSAEEVAQAIRSMAIRGAPALGIAGAFGMALHALNCSQCAGADLRANLKDAAGTIIASRPTAVNLAWGVNRIRKLADDRSLPDALITERILQEALEMAEEDVRTNLLLAQHGASLIDDGDTIIHHCNTGGLAAVEWGTALGAIRYAHEHGKKVHVLVDETRPRLQGSRLTAWECGQYGIPYTIITDNAAGYFLETGQVQKVFFGADRVAANGDVVNKIGTYMLSLAAHANHVQVVCVFPLSTLDLNTPTGAEVCIEERDPSEVLSISLQGEQATPAGAAASNPAFDITPHDLISAMVTERGIITPPYDKNLPRCSYNNGLDN